MRRLIPLLLPILLLIAAPLHAGAAVAGDDEAIVVIDEGKVYRKVNGEPITGKDVIDLIVERKWEESLQIFVEHSIRTDEVRKNSIVATDEEVDAELKYLFDKFADAYGIPKDKVKLENIAQGLNLVAFKRDAKLNVAMIKIFQQEGKLKPGVHIDSPEFKEALRERLEALLGQKGVVSEKEKLGKGEAVRIGNRGFGHNEVRAFIAEANTTLPLSDMKTMLDLLTLDWLVKQALKEWVKQDPKDPKTRSSTIDRKDKEFHFSYLCRKRGYDSGIDGRTLLRRDMQNEKMTPEQYLNTRQFIFDAGITKMASSGLTGQALKAEFAKNPKKYHLSDKLCAHVMIHVLDPQGQPYGPNWKVGGMGAINQLASRAREQQFADAKPKIQALVKMAKEDFEKTARQYSEDVKTAPVGGKIGRVGAETILLPPCDNAIRDASAKLKPGDISEPVRSDFGWHLVKCLDKQDVSFEEVEERVYVNLIFEAKTKIMEELLKTAKVEEFK